MAQSAAHMRATAKWRKKAIDRLPFDVRKDAEINGDAIRAHAKHMGESMNAFIRRAVTETIARDKASVPVNTHKDDTDHV